MKKVKFSNQDIDYYSRVEESVNTLDMMASNDTVQEKKDGS